MAHAVSISACEVCGNADLRTVLELGNHPLCGDLIKVGNNERCQEYPIEILFCPMCITAHQKYQVPKEELFHYEYQYRARMTPSVLSGMESLVESVADQLGALAGKKVLDVGCNEGLVIILWDLGNLGRNWQLLSTTLAINHGWIPWGT